MADNNEQSVGAMTAKGELKDITFEAVVIRADGTREDLGVIARMEKSEIEQTPGLVKRLKKWAKSVQNQSKE